MMNEKGKDVLDEQTKEKIGNYTKHYEIEMTKKLDKVSNEEEVVAVHNQCLAKYLAKFENEKSLSDSHKWQDNKRSLKKELSLSFNSIKTEFIVKSIEEKLIETKNRYIKNMQNFEESKNWFSEDLLQENHNKEKEYSRNLFQSKLHNISPVNIEMYLDKLSDLVDLEFNVIKKRIEIKRKEELENKVEESVSLSNNRVIVSKKENEVQNSSVKLEVTKIEVENGKFDNQFIRLGELGSGAFGKVYKMSSKSNKKLFAIKKYYFNGINREIFDREVQMLRELKTKVVVDFKNAWIEEEFGFIQMELCLFDLNHLIKIKDEAFDRIGSGGLNMDYYISFELFRELIDCINYLHSFKPPIIHRDLKPANILITNGSNGRYVKLCDFGLAIYHIKSSHTRGAGTEKFIAPENSFGRKYNHKVDIYSLGIVSEDLLRGLLRRNTLIINDGQTAISQHYNQFESVLDQMKCRLPEDRPESSDILKLMEGIGDLRDIIKRDANNRNDFDFRYHQLFLNSFFKIKMRSNSE